MRLIRKEKTYFSGDTSIKIQNIYYLFLYAWDKFNEGNLVKTGTEHSQMFLIFLQMFL